MIRRLTAVLAVSAAVTLGSAPAAHAASGTDFAGARATACVQLLVQHHVSLWGTPYRLISRTCR